MREVRFLVNFGGYIGAEDEYSIMVNDDATQDEIEDAIADKFDEIIHDNCYWEIIEEEEE